MLSSQHCLKQIDKYNLNFLTKKTLIGRLAGLNNKKNEEIEILINNLLESGDLFVVSKGKLATSSKLGYVKGEIVGNKNGFAFLIREDGEDDVFIANHNLKGAMHQDIVVAKINKATKGKKCDGEVVKIIDHKLKTLVGKIEIFKNFAFVVPDNKKIFKDVFISKKDILNAKNGDKVFVKITSFEGKNLTGKVIESLGYDDGSFNTDVLSIIRSYELIEKFNNEVLQEAKNISQQLSPSQIKGRLDLRKEIIFTIDGDDSKDFDDAVSIDYDNGFYTLGVHIADVGEYVKMGSALDKEAFERGTSAYFPNMVLPMLPVELSNGICSLNPKQDRLSLSCIMKIDKQGNVVEHKIAESVINSCERMTYNNVTKILQGDPELNKTYSHIVEKLKIMEELTYILEKVRKDRGAVDFDIPEPKIILDSKNEEVDVLIKRPRTISERLIESFMLIANETIAKHFNNLKIPFVYRVHEKPEEAKLKSFNSFVAGLNLHLSLNDLSSKSMQEFLSKLDGLDVKEVVNKVLLRCMQKAKYSPTCLGHFGLAATDYCHFTSPIRRYPDLTIHRIIKQWLHKELDSSNLKSLKKFVIESSTKSSEREVLAEKAERDVDDYYKARYMQKHIGESFDGVISSVTNFGLFVELDNTVEGFVSIESLPGTNYLFNPDALRLSNNDNKFTMGDKVKVVVSSVILDERKVNFEIKSRI